MKLTKEQKDTVLEMANEGLSLKKILTQICVGAQSFYKYVHSDLAFATEFARARHQGLENLSDDLLDIADDTELDEHRARLC